MLIKITEADKIDDKKLMAVYSEGNIENAEYFYPQIEDRAEAVKMVETDFCNFVKNEFLDGKNAYYVFSVNGVWVSALRLNYVEPSFYYIEAIETAPAFRKKGYATELLSEVLRDLKPLGHFKICDCVGKKNSASLATHFKCGFVIASERGYDYLQREYDDGCYGLEYSC